MSRTYGDAKMRAALRAAQLYYEHHLTMGAIADDLRVSRSSVSRMLSEAREIGLVEIKVHSPQEARSRLEQRFFDRWGVIAHVVPSAERESDTERLDRTAQVAARLIAGSVMPHHSIGVAWGTTVSAVARHLPRTPVADTRVVQMNGAANGYSTGLSYAMGLLGGFGNAFSAEIFQFPVPAVFDDPDTRGALWRERSITRVVELQRSVSLFVFGLGSRIGDTRSHIYSGGYLDRADLSDLERNRVVGDCATVFYRADGSTDDILLNERTSGPPFDVVRRIPQRICVVASPAKRDSLRGALAAGIITDLVVDEGLARRVLSSEEASE